MDMWMDVDTALSEVPVNLLPLVDATDFKTIEDAVAYNAAGMALRWHFVTTGGLYTVTSVTPTSGGSYDWTDQGDSGVYTIEIPASGGASINNDTEGFGWFTGKADGVLPWRGPVIGFRAAALNDALIDSAWSTTRGLAGTALPNAAADAAGGLPISDAGGLDLDARLDAAVSSRSTLTQTQVSGGAYSLASASFVCGDTRIANLDATVSSRSTLTQAQVSGGAYTLASASFVCGDTRLANLDATISSRGTSTLTQTQVTGGAYSLSSASFVCGDTRIANLDAAVSSRMATYSQPAGFLAATFPTTVASTTNITSATGIDVTKWSGTTVATPDTAGYPKATIKSGTGTGEISLTSGGVSIKTSGIVRSTFGPDSGLQLIAYGTLDANPVSSSAILAYVPSVISGSLVTTAGAFYKGCLIRLMAGTGAGQVRRISDSSYDSGSQSITFTVKRAFITTPNSATTYAIYPSDSALVTDDIDADSIKADAVTEIQSGLSTLTAAGVRSAVGLASANLDTQLGTLATPTNITAATGIVLASNGLDSISTTAPTGVASNFREMLVQLWRRFFKRATKSATDIKTYADNGTTVVTTQTISTSGDDETQGAAS